MRHPSSSFRARRAGALLFSLVFIFVSKGSAEASGSRGVGALDGKNARVEAELLVDVESAEVGQSFRAGVFLRIDRGWHVYWKNSGASGFPTEVDFVSPSVEFGPLQFPAPEVFLESGGLATTYGYSNDVMLIADAIVQPGAAGLVEIEADLRFLVCKVLCIPGEIHLEMDLAIAHGSRRANSKTTALFDRFAARMPLPAESLGIRVDLSTSFVAVESGEGFEIGIAISPCLGPSRECPSNVGFVESPGEVAFDAPDSLDLETLGTIAHPSAEKGSQFVVRGRVLQGQVPPKRVEGVLGLLIDGQRRSVEISLALPTSEDESFLLPAIARAPSPTARSTSGADMALWIALGFGLLGGLILNLMPCVLPILALKAFRIVESTEKNSAQLRSQGVAYTLGSMSSMAVLAAVVVGLREAGDFVGWGFQFQEPAYIAFMTALLTAFALNLFDVFEIRADFNRFGRIGADSSATAGSFFDGILVVLLATPCSAPFLGTAVGFAFSASAASIVAVFLSIGFGLAFPFLAISWLPALGSRLPKPGIWMSYLRVLLGFALLATVLWLLWIAGQSVGSDGLVWLLGYLLLLGLALWTFGQLQGGDRPASTRIVAAVIVVAACAGLFVLPLEPGRVEASPDSPGIRRWDSAEVQKVVNDGKIAFVDFTADWCLSCKANERLVLSSDQVREEMRRLGVVRFRADWTLRDDMIRAELEKFGRAGVPLYLVFHPGSKGLPLVLPELLTANRVIAALAERSAFEDSPMDDAQLLTSGFHSYACDSAWRFPVGCVPTVLSGDAHPFSDVVERRNPAASGRLRV